jgi:hypothetical protein
MREGRFLDYWSANMCFAWELSHGAQWPGFRYSDGERALMRERAERISRGQFRAFMATATILFIVAAGLLVGLGMVPLLGWFWPDPARMPAAGFFGIMAAVIALAIGPVFLAVLRASAWLADRMARGGAAPAPATDEHAALSAVALSAKVRWQFLRMALVLGGLFVPGVLLWSTLNADLRAGIVWSLNAAYALVMALSILGLVARRRKQG